MGAERRQARRLTRPGGFEAPAGWTCGQGGFSIATDAKGLDWRAATPSKE
jgi:hypothetical protein